MNRRAPTILTFFPRHRLLIFVYAATFPLAAYEVHLRVNPPADMEQVRSRAASQYLATACQLYPQRPNCDYLIGREYVKTRGDLERARMHFEKALSSGIKTDEHLLKSYADTLLQLNEDPEKIDAAIANWVRNFPGSWQEARQLQSRSDYLKKAAELRTAGVLDEAIRLAGKMVESNPKFVIAHHDLIRLLDETHRNGEAVPFYRRLVERHPDNADAHLFLADALHFAGNPDEAASHARRSIQLRSGYAPAFYRLGEILYLQNNLEAAAQSFQAALKIRPNHPESHNNLGTVFARQGDLRKAMACFEEALRLRPEYEDARKNFVRAKQFLKEPIE